VPVYDRNIVLLAKPEEESKPETRPSSVRKYDRSPFQFDLQSMLILTVAVACAASCYSIHYRRLKPQWDAIARLEAFAPQIYSFSNHEVSCDEVWRLDFSGCLKKPTDDDLVCLEPLRKLHTLDLSGSPITDAGLIHLKGLTRLSWIDLTNTRVTTRGIEALQRALPDAHIRPHTTVPIVPAAPAAKAANKK
jgi:hypothetical protein